MLFKLFIVAVMVIMTLGTGMILWDLSRHDQQLRFTLVLIIAVTCSFGLGETAREKMN